jgi:hypothetical protein
MITCYLADTNIDDRCNLTIIQMAYFQYQTLNESLLLLETDADRSLLSNEHRIKQ